MLSRFLVILLIGWYAALALTDLVEAVQARSLYGIKVAVIDLFTPTVVQVGMDVAEAAEGTVRECASSSDTNCVPARPHGAFTPPLTVTERNVDAGFTPPVTLMDEWGKRAGNAS